MKTQKITKKQKVKTHLQTVREAYALNLHFLKKDIGLSTRDYNSLLFDTCMGFIEEVYPPGSPFRKYYLKQAASKSYWSWFKSEWMIFETNYLYDNRASNTPLTFENWEGHMEKMIISQSVEDSYYNIYLKSIRDER